MKALHFLKTCTALAATSVLLVACGGGNDDDPSPSNEPGVLTVSNATVDGLNGVYGNGALNLTDVDKKNPIGSVPELCTFRFDVPTRWARPPPRSAISVTARMPPACTKCS